MRLTVDLVEGAAQYIHPATRDRELDLRGYKIPLVENMGATLDQFDSIDFSDNDIKKLENFPLLKRVTKLLLSNNRITKIQDHLEEFLPNLSWLILTNNNIQEPGDLDGLSTLPKLQYLSLLGNPVVTKKHYRLYVIHKIPQVRILDFKRVKLREREEAGKLFKGKKGKTLEQEIGLKSAGEFVPGEPTETEKEQTRKGLTLEEIESIKEAISKASSLEEIDRLNQALKSGLIPSKQLPPKDKTSQAMEVEEAH